MTEQTVDAAAVPTTMRAWRQRRYGGPDVLQLETVAVPVPRKDEVLVRVDAVGLNAADIHLMRGDPLAVRPIFGLRRPRVAGRGLDAAGTVVATGPAVAGTSIGDRIVGQFAGGALAEYVCGRVGVTAQLPAGLDAAVAAGLPVAGVTAWQALDEAQLGGAAPRVLVIGAAGGVGVFTVQIAALRGAEVWALCGRRAERLIASLGAAHVFDYRAVDLRRPPSAFPADGFDAVIDIGGRDALVTLRSLLAPGGRAVLVSGEGGRVLGPIPRLLRSAAASLGRSEKLVGLVASAHAPTLAKLVALAAEGRITVPIQRSYPFDDARSAVAHVAEGHTVGKVVVRV